MAVMWRLLDPCECCRRLALPNSITDLVKTRSGNDAACMGERGPVGERYTTTELDQMRQVTTPTTMPTAERNALVVAANIPCQAIGCERKATRWSNLCGLCEKQFLEDMKPVFGKPSADHLTAAQAVLRSHYASQIKSGVFDDWASQIGRTFARPVAKVVSPLGMRRYRSPRERFGPLLALRTRDRGVLTRKGVINLLAFALAVDAMITPTIPQPVRRDYMVAMLGHRFMGRAVYSKTVVRIRMKRVSTGTVRYGPNGPQEVTKLVEEEVPTKEYFRIRRADMRYIGRQLWKALEKTVLTGGRQGADWRGLQDCLRGELS
jgi:hypothetical protein